MPKRNGRKLKKGRVQSFDKQWMQHKKHEFEAADDEEEEEDEEKDEEEEEDEEEEDEQEEDEQEEEFEWMRYEEAHEFETEAKSKKVSKVARSPRGFMRHYEGKTPEEMRHALVPDTNGQTWGARRSGFIKRTLPQYMKKKTRRRWLALVMWAYWPGKPPKE